MDCLEISTFAAHNNKQYNNKQHAYLTMNHKMQAHLPQIDLDKMQAVLDIETRYVTGKITLEEGRKEVAERVGKIRPFHLAFIEQTLIEHTDEECIRENMAQKIQLFEGYMDYSRPDVPEDHPLSRYYQENEEMKRLLLAVEDLVQYPVIKNQWLELFDQIRKYPIHYSRKQNQLYPLLEKKASTVPPPRCGLLTTWCATTSAMPIISSKQATKKSSSSRATNSSSMVAI